MSSAKSPKRLGNGAYEELVFKLRNQKSESEKPLVTRSIGAYGLTIVSIIGVALIVFIAVAVILSF